MVINTGRKVFHEVFHRFKNFPFDGKRVSARLRVNQKNRSIVSILIRRGTVIRGSNLDPPKVMVTSYSVPLRADALTNGAYLATFPESVVRLNAGRYPLKVLPIDLALAARPAAIITFKNRTLAPLVEPFVACAREVAKSIAERRPRSL